MRPFPRAAWFPVVWAVSKVTDAGRASVWDPASDLFMQPHISAGFWWWPK